MKCEVCNKIIWFWQKHYDYSPDLHNLTTLGGSQEITIYHYHYDCTKIEEEKKK